MSAAAQLLTAVADCAPQSRARLCSKYAPRVPRWPSQIEFEVVIVRGDVGEGLRGGGTKWRAPQVRMHQHARAVDDRLNPGARQCVQRGADARDDRVASGNLFRAPQGRQFPPDDRDDRRPRQPCLAQGLQDFLDGRNAAEQLMVHGRGVLGKLCQSVDSTMAGT